MPLDATPTAISPRTELELEIGELGDLIELAKEANLASIDPKVSYFVGAVMRHHAALQTKFTACH